MSVSIDIKGVDELIRKLGTIGAMKTLRPAMKDSVNLLHQSTGRYPPPRAGSSYVRTDVLKNSYTTKIETTPRSMIGKVGTNLGYAPFVQSHQFQAWMHKGRWPTDLDIMEKNRPAIVAKFEQAINKAINK